MRYFIQVSLTILLISSLSAQATVPCAAYLHSGKGKHPLVGLEDTTVALDGTIRISRTIKTKLGYQLVYVENIASGGFNSLRLLHNLILYAPRFAKSYQLRALNDKSIIVPDLDMANRINQKLKKSPLTLKPVKGEYSSDEFIAAWAEKMILEASEFAVDQKDLSRILHFHDTLIHRYGFLFLPIDFVDVTVDLAAFIRSAPKMPEDIKQMFVTTLDGASDTPNFIEEEFPLDEMINDLESSKMYLGEVLKEIKGFVDSSDLSPEAKARFVRIAERAAALDSHKMAKEVLEHLKIR